MVERRQRLGFPLEPGEPLGVLRKRVRQDLIATCRPRLVSVARYAAPCARADRRGDVVGTKTGARGERHWLGFYVKDEL
jgi:hypothetical protein